MIDIIVPVLARPQNAAPLVESVRANTTLPWRVWFICSPDDVEEQEAVFAQADGDWRVLPIIASWAPGPGDYARKINLGYRVSGVNPEPYPWLFLGADDLTFEPGWDIAAFDGGDQAVKGGASVIGTDDLANPLVGKGGHSTHTLVRRAYVAAHGLTWDNEPGLVYAECYDHQCVDNELVAVAKERGVWAFAAGSRVRHRHPLFDRSVRKDATYEKALAHGADDMQLFRKRQRTLGGKA